MSVSADVRETVERLRDTVAELHTELTRNGLVIWTAGNVSARVPGRDLMVIKPSGVSYDELSGRNMVVTDLHGELVDGELAPSSDTAAHAYVYRHMPEVGGVVHTHSTYATAWAARGEPIPCVLTMIADEFGGEIPVGPFALIGDDSIGRGIVETLRTSRSPAVLMRNHGPFTVGKDARAAVKAAVMVEDVARTVHIAHQLGELPALRREDIDRLHHRYQNVYGQR
jgi:L-ribulose-5-phosphate 4-epimerase